LVPELFRGGRGAGERVVLKYQVTLLVAMGLLFLLLLHGNILTFPPFSVLLALFLVSLMYFNYLTWSGISGLYRADFQVFRDYTTVFSILLVWILFSYKVLVSWLVGNSLLGPFAKKPQILVAGLLVFWVLVCHWWVNRRYSRGYTYGMVEGVEGGFARVSLYFDPRAGVKPGEYVLADPVNLEPGDIVEVTVRRSFPFPFTGSKPARIVRRVARGL